MPFACDTERCYPALICSVHAHPIPPRHHSSLSLLPSEQFKIMFHRADLTSVPYTCSPTNRAALSLSPSPGFTFTFLFAFQPSMHFSFPQVGPPLPCVTFLCLEVMLCDHAVNS